MSRLILFLIPAEKDVNGGLLSIFSLARESRRFKTIHHSDVAISTFPGTESYKKNDLFDNDETILDFGQVMKRYPKLDSLVLHIPEFAVIDVYYNLKEFNDYLAAIPDLHINILNQNIELMPKVEDTVNLFDFTRTVTQTTAHLRSASQQLADEYGIPTHLFSVSIDPSQYERLRFIDKQKVIAYSPDEHPSKQKTLALLRQNLPSFEFVEIKNMPYAEFKQVASSCMFMLTFGEGFDGYLIETTFSGGITFAVYNEEFFPSASYKKLANIYLSYDELISHVVDDITSLRQAEQYDKLNDENFEALAQIYNYKKYLKNIENFYAKKYLFLPTEGALTNALLYAVKQKDEQTLTRIEHIQEQQGVISEQQGALDAQQSRLVEQQGVISEQQATIEEQQATIARIFSSSSWKVTKPLRGAGKLKSLKGRKPGPKK